MGFSVRSHGGFSWKIILGYFYHKVVILYVSTKNLQGWQGTYMLKLKPAGLWTLLPTVPTPVVI